MGRLLCATHNSDQILVLSVIASNGVELYKDAGHILSRVFVLGLVKKR